MALEIGIALSAGFFGLLGLSLALYGLKKHRLHREMLEFLAQQNEELEKSVAANLEVIEKTGKRVTAHSRRIAGLETRVRQPKLDAEEVLEEQAPNVSFKSNITERRHRVLTLAARGQNSENIA